MVCASLFHIIALAYQVKYSSNNAWQVFLLIAATLITITALKSPAQFSSRYPFQAVPFLLLYCAGKIKVTPGLFARSSVGIAIGILSLMLFYHQ
jgi:hypothetical protein